MTGYSAAADFAAGTITLTGTTAVTAGQMTVTIGGLTLGNPTVGNDQGVTVAAPGHATSTGVPSGPISGYQVTKVTVSGTCQTSAACRTVTIAVSSAGAASTIASSLDITGLPFSGTPDAMYFTGSSSRGTLVTSNAVGAVTAGKITLTVNSGGAAWSLGPTATITLSGLTLTATAAFTASTISVGGSTAAYSATYVASSTGTTTTSPLALARAVPGTTNTQATVTFSTTNGIADGNVVRVYFPSGFFIANAPLTTDCTGSTFQAITATGLGSCNTLTVNTANFNNGWIAVTYNTLGPGTAAGSQTLVLSGVSLSTTEKAATNGFYVVTTSSSCSAGGASTGTISNSNPGGPGAKASSAVSAVLSVAAAVAVAVMLML